MPVIRRNALCLLTPYALRGLDSKDQLAFLVFGSLPVALKEWNLGNYILYSLRLNPNANFKLCIVNV
jgi:hypothetical protein